MNKIEEAKDILKDLGLPSAQQNEISAFTLLALGGIKPGDKWKKTSNLSLKVTKGIMAFVAENYDKKYAPNTRENFRRQVLHQFIQAGIVDYNRDNPKLPVNSPNAHYDLTQAAFETIKTYNTKNYKKALKKFNDEKENLSKKYQKDRKKNLIPVKLSNGKSIELSAGKHNELQAVIIHNFATRFANEGTILYLGDAAKKNLYVDEKKLKELHIPINQHSKLPDVVIYDQNKNWLFLIEAVTSHGPVSPKRLIELEDFLQKCKTEKIYVSAFPDFSEFKKYSNHIAWETEVWIADTPDHMIHFNGDRFIGPR